MHCPPAITPPRFVRFVARSGRVCCCRFRSFCEYNILTGLFRVSAMTVADGHTERMSLRYVYRVSCRGHYREDASVDSGSTSQAIGQHSEYEDTAVPEAYWCIFAGAVMKGLEGVVHTTVRQGLSVSSAQNKLPLLSGRLWLRRR